MDKRDFYRELMEKYAFDKDKIYMNAKSGKYIGNKHKRSYPVYIGMTAAAAALAVTVGALAARVGKTPDVVRTLPGDASVVSQSGEETSAYSGASSASEQPSDSSADSVGVSPFVSDKQPGEPGSELYSESAPAPDSSTPADSLPDSTDSTVSTESTVSTQTKPSEPGSAQEPDESDPVSHIECDVKEVRGLFPTAITLPEDSSSMSVPIEVLIAMPEGAELPFNPDRFMYLTGDIGAKRAYFLNDDTLYVRTADEMRLYKMNGGEPVLSSSLSCGNAVTFWIAENGGRQLAYDGGRLYDVNAESGTVTEKALNVAGDIAEIAYNEDMGVLALKVFNDGVYSLVVFEDGFSDAKTVYSSDTAFSLIAASGGITGIGNSGVFIGAASESELTVYKVTPDGEASVAARLQGKYAVSRNAAFTHAVLEGGLVNVIFDPDSFGMMSVTGADAEFGVSKHSFISSEGCFTIKDGRAEPSGGVSVMAQLDFERSFSRIYLAAVENGAVRIVDGVYTDRARTDSLSLVIPEENASAEMRAAVNAAVGLQNALSGGLCESLGITGTQTLDALLKGCFSESAAAAVKQRSGVGEGEALTYRSGGFYPINLSDTVLVISGETETGAEGTLYINAGSFGGGTAYYSCAVKLQRTENGYAADGIIE